MSPFAAADPARASPSAPPVAPAPSNAAGTGPVAAPTSGSSQPAAPAAVPASEEVTLVELLAFADLHSPELSVARSTRTRADAVRAAASPLLPANPEINVAAGPRRATGATGLDAEVGLTQTIEIAGERGLRFRVADRFRELIDAEIDLSRWVVHSDVHALYHRALVERARVKLSEQILSFQADVLRIVERQISAGETAPLSLRLARAEVGQAQQVLIATQQAYFASRIRLAQLTGWPVQRPPSPAGSVDAPHEPPGLAELLSIARQRVPLLRVRSAAVREAEARADLAGREVWPKPSLGVQFRREGNPGIEGISNSFLGTLTIPIPSFQTNQAGRARARSDLNVAQTELAATQAVLEAQIVEARSAVVAAAQRTAAYGSEILPRFDENLRLLRRSFELGEIDLLALSVARERFLRIQGDALNAQLDYFDSLSRLERLIGLDLWHDVHSQEIPR